MESYQHLGRFAFSSDGKYLLMGYLNDGSILLWDFQKQEKVYEISYEWLEYGENDPKLIVSPNNKYFLIVGDLRISIHEFKTGHQLYSIAGGFGSGDGVSFALPILFSKNGRYVLLHNDEETPNFMVWDIEARKKVNAFGEDAFYASFVDNGRYIATLSTSQNTTTLEKNDDYSLWNVLTRAQLHHVNLGGDYNFLRFSPDGRFMLVARTTESTQTLWNLVSGHPLHTFNIDQWYADEFTPDNRYLLIVDVVAMKKQYFPQVYRMWDIKLNRARSDFSIEVMGSNPKVSPNGKYLIDIRDNELRLLNLETGKQMHLDC